MKIIGSNIGKPDSYTKLLIHGNALLDVAGSRTITNNNTVTVNQSGGKFGGGIKFVSASSQYLTIPDSNDWAFGDYFTLDFVVTFTTFPSANGEYNIFDQYTDGPNRVFLGLERTAQGALKWRWCKAAGGIDLEVNTTLSTGVPYHIALVKNGTGSNNHNLYVDGTSINTWTDSTAYADYSGSLNIGRHSSGVYYLNGMLEEYRISNVARWTGNFTPPKRKYGSQYN